MTNLTLKQLRRAIEIVEHVNKSKSNTTILQLVTAEAYMTGKIDVEPAVDPREILTAIGYKW